MRRMWQVALVAGASLMTGCADTPVQPSNYPERQAARDALPTGMFGHAVFMGTSISMGWASNGVYAGSQLVSWPLQLAQAADTTITLPLIQNPGCTPPLAAPLAAGSRLDGEPINSTVCAPNVSGVVLPTQNVALAGALAADALRTTPAQAPADQPFYARVLPPGATQLSAALSQNPKLVSVELGGNEVLGALKGLVSPGVSTVPFPYFAAPFDMILDSLSARPQTRVLLAGMPTNATNIPALRSAAEIWGDRLEFAALNIVVSDDCATSPNWINVSVKSLEMGFEGAYRAAHNLGPATFSCADGVGEDEVLTPDDIAYMNGLLTQMADHVKQQASARGYAYFSLGALYDRPGLKPEKYSVIAHLTTTQPFGPYISLDGVHPSEAGHALLAAAAADALSQRYFGGAHVFHVAPPVATPSRTFSSSLSLLNDHALRMNAARVVLMSTCPVPGICRGSR